MRIVFFDSGVGGLTVLREACVQLPAEDYVYYADTAHVPYGVHSKEEVSRFVKTSIDEITRNFDVKAIVVACNTATSVAIEDIRSSYDVPIVGMEPAVKPALQAVERTDKRVLVTATPLTLKEKKFQALVSRIDRSGKVDVLALPGLVTFAEKRMFADEAVRLYLREQLTRFDLDAYGAVVLGCTHFLYFKKLLRDELPAHIQLFDGNRGTVSQLKRMLTDRNLTGGTGKADIVYLSSGGKEEEIRNLQACFRYLNEETSASAGEIRTV